MKKLQKLMVLVLAAVMICGCFGSYSAKAATAAPKLGVSKKTMYVGGSLVASSCKETYSLYFKNRPESYKISWSSSNESVLAIVKKTKTRAVIKGIKPGTATITAKVTDNSTKKVTTYTCKVTVKKNCAAVAITNKASVTELKPGDALKLTAAMYNADGSAAKKGTDTTDTIRFASSDTAVATVDSNGNVKAVAPGEATITCYTIQATTGTYSVIGKATHKDTVKVKVVNPEVLKSVEQTALNQFVIKFNSPIATETITNDSFVLKTTSGVNVPLKKPFEAASDKLSVTITTESNLVSKLSYVLSYAGESRGFEAVDATVPTSIKISTAGNVAVAGEATQVKVRFFNGIVDITPKEGSTEYTNLTSKMSYSTTPLYSSDWYITSSGLLTFHNAGKTAEVTGKYKPNWYSTSDSEILTASVAVTSVTEASTIEFDKVIVTNSTKTGKDLDWENSASYVCAGDTGYKIVARLKKVTTGEYIYSTDAGSKVQFDIPSENKLNSPLYVDSTTGEILAVNQGTAQIMVFYGDKSNMANVKSVASVAVAGARVPATMILSQDGKPVDSAVISGQYGLEKLELTATIYDQYGDVIKLNSTNIAGFTYAFDGKNGPVPVITANEDGTASIVADPLGYTDYKAGSTSVYSYKISFVSGKTTLTQGLALIIQMPDDKLPASYKLEISGKADTAITSSMTELPKLSIKLFDLRDGIKYAQKTLLPKSQATANGQFYYEVTGPKGSVTTGLGINEIGLVTESGSSSLDKLPEGNYTIVVYEKSASGNIARASASFTVTGGQTVVKAERKKNSTTVKISTGMTDAEKKNAFLECFSIKVGGLEVAASNIELVIPNIMDGVMYVSSVKVSEVVTIGDKLYTQKYEIAIGEAILN